MVPVKENRKKEGKKRKKKKTERKKERKKKRKGKPRKESWPQKPTLRTRRRHLKKNDPRLVRKRKNLVSCL